MNTATIKRLPPDEVRHGLAALRRDHRSGRLRQVIARYQPLAQQYGDGSVFTAYSSPRTLGPAKGHIQGSAPYRLAS